MAAEIVLPQWGMEMQDGTIVRWLKQEGDVIQEGEPIVEVETAKIQTELESIASGVLAHILVPEGATVPIRAILAIVAAPGEEVARPGGSPAPASSQPQAATVAAARSRSSVGADGRPGVQVVPVARRLAQEHGVDLASVQGTGPRGRIMISDVERAILSPPTAAPSAGRVQVVPAARRLAQENGVDLDLVQGSGPGGRILIEDVERAINLPAKSPDQVVPLEGIRRTIATRMLLSLQTMAQVTLTTEANVSQAMTLRAGLSRQWEGQSLSPLHLVIKATARALKAHPRMNGHQEDEQVRLLDQINIGIAVSLPEGLITPVIPEADGKGLAQIASEARDLATRTREGKARPEDVLGGTFTVTNLGVYDIDGFTPIINPPQVGILGVGRVVEKPIIENGQVAKGDMMFLSLTFDHRVVDGAPAAEFLQSVKQYLEDPWWMVA
jgi:pyruvate dehydrogenase E2 component (dihydrolipoamide acetyltransferase)